MKSRVLALLLLASTAGAEPLFAPAESVLWSHIPLMPDIVRSAAARGVGGGGGALAAGAAVTGCTSKLLFANASSLLDCDVAFVADDSGAGNGVITVTKTPSGSAATSNFLSVVGTMPSTMTASTRGVQVTMTGAGSSSQTPNAMRVDFAAGYTGTNSTNGLVVLNSNIGTASATTTFTAFSGNSAFQGTANPNGAGDNLGVLGSATNTTGRSFGVIGLGRGTAGSLHVGVVGVTNDTATIEVGGYFALGATLPTFVTSAVTANNGAIAAPIFVAQDNATNVLSIANGGALQGDITTALTDNTIKTFAIQTLGNDLYSGGTIKYCIWVQDATTAALECGSADYAGVDVTAGAGGEVCSNPTKVGTPLQALSGATLTVTFAATTGTDLCNLRVTADGNIATPVTFVMRYVIISNSGNLVTPQP